MGQMVLVVADYWQPGADGARLLDPSSPILFQRRWAAPSSKKGRGSGRVAPLIFNLFGPLFLPSSTNNNHARLLQSDHSLLPYPVAQYRFQPYFALRALAHSFDPSTPGFHGRPRSPGPGSGFRFSHFLPLPQVHSLVNKKQTRSKLAILLHLSTSLLRPLSSILLHIHKL